MAVTHQMIRNALEMTLDDYTSDPESVTSDELVDVRKRFASIIDNTLIPDCEDEDDDDDDDEVEVEEEDEEK